jgi:hypothetical protein
MAQQRVAYNANSPISGLAYVILYSIQRRECALCMHNHPHQSASTRSNNSGSLMQSTMATAVGATTTTLGTAAAAAAAALAPAASSSSSTGSSGNDLPVRLNEHSRCVSRSVRLRVCVRVRVCCSTVAPIKVTPAPEPIDAPQCFACGGKFSLMLWKHNWSVVVPGMDALSAK